jgi:flagellar hook assembly protein FlgD
MLFVTNPSSTVEALRITNSGNLGIGTTTPTAKLHNKGTVRFENLPSGTGNILVADANGNVYRSSQTARIASSSADSDEIAALKEKIDQLEQALQALQQQLSPVKGSIEVSATDNRSYQLELSPNPAAATTSIRYSYPSGANAAYVNISDQSGRLVKRIDIRAANKSALSLSAKDVAVSSGTYVCSLEVNGKIVASKQVVFIK